MNLRTLLFGKPLRSDAEAEEQIGSAGVGAIVSAIPFIVSHRALRLKARLLLEGGPHVSVMSTPWYPDLTPAKASSEQFASRHV